MSVDTHQLLSGLLDIYNESDFGENDMSSDLGDRLIEIQSMAKTLLEAAGWDPEADEDQDELEDDGK